MKVKYQKFNSKRKFGVEFELSNNLSKRKIKDIIEENSQVKVKTTRYALSYQNNFWHIKNDASCGPYGTDGCSGVEIATYICSGLQDANHISNVINKVSRENGKVNKHCGLHVHVDVSDYEEEDVGRLIMYWLQIEKIFMYALPSSRHNNIYCRPLSFSIDNWVANYFYKSLGNKFVARLFKPKNDPISMTNSKRTTMNINNFYQAYDLGSNIRKTIEFRCPEGTLQGDDAKAWIFLFVNFIDYVKFSKKIPNKFLNKKIISIKDLFNLFGLYHNESFSIYDKNFMHTREWLLNRFIKNSDIINESTQRMLKKEAQTLLDNIHKLN